MQSKVRQTESRYSITCFWQNIIAVLGISTLLLASLKSYANPPIANPLLQLDAQEIAAAYGGKRVYKVTRNNKEIGTHALSFINDGDDLTVKVDSSITVRILRIPVYRLSYVATELWRDNVLVSTSATTTENGESTTVSWDNTNGRNEVRFASNHWHPGVLTGSSVFNTLTGNTSSIKVSTVGVEQIEIGPGDVITATHYKYNDDIQANVWYDTDGLWLKMSFDGEDGSAIQYLRTD
ncbi:MAG: DUF6134 family protein [Granulosicoccus sp.]